MVILEEGVVVQKSAEERQDSAWLQVSAHMMYDEQQVLSIEDESRQKMPRVSWRPVSMSLSSLWRFQEKQICCTAGIHLYFHIYL